MLRTVASRVAATIPRTSRASTTIARALGTFTDKDIVIVSAARTPIGSFSKTLKGIPAPRLGAIAIKEAVARAGIAVEDVEEVYMGAVNTAGMGQAPARQASLAAGIPESVPCATVNKVCASGLKTVMIAAQAINFGYQDIIVAGGMESMTQTPHILKGARSGYPYGHGQLLDSLQSDGLFDVYNKQMMGWCADQNAKSNGITREECDEYAIRSYQRSAIAVEGGKFDKEVVPVPVPQRRGDPIMFARDEEYTNVKLDKVTGLKPVFSKDGVVTAANASTLSDGGSAVVVMSGKAAKERGITPLAKIISFADGAHAPVDFPTAPTVAVKLALERAKMTIDDIDYNEVNEAFASVVLANVKNLGMDMEKVNINGGAISLGHPLGCSANRILVTLMHVLQQQDASMGCVSVCNGGGGAGAMIIERLS